MNLKNIFSKKTNTESDTLKSNHITDGEVISRKEIQEIIRKREKRSSEEFDRGYNLIKKYPRSVSIFGSARFKEGNVYYEKARSLGARIVNDLGYAVVTGGGPGIMEAANKGAFEAGGDSLGFIIKLPNEQYVNEYLKDYVNFEYFFSRKTLLFFAAESYVYFPGGFGTLDELLEVVTLIQTEKMKRTPIILVGKEFWTPFLELFEQKLAIENQTIDMKDIELYKIVDSEDEIIDIIRKAPYRAE